MTIDEYLDLWISLNEPMYLIMFGVLDDPKMYIHGILDRSIRIGLN